MRVEDLRVGNLVIESLPFGTDKIITVTLRNISSVDVKDNWEPIPLTEEILLDCGFVTDNITFKIKKNGYRLSLFQINRANQYNDNENEFTVTVYQSGQSIEICRIKHVHQLQNIFHALTGEELEFKILGK